MENNYQEEVIIKLIIKIMKIVGGLLLVYILLSIVYGAFIEIKNGKNKEIKIKYTPSDITKKYPHDFIKAEEVMSEIKRSVNSSYTKTTGEDEITTYLDSRGLVVYKITQNLKIQISAQGGKGGYNVRKYPPNEEGYVYDLNGNMVNKIEGGLYSPHSKDPFKRASKFNWKKILNSIKITTIGYDNFGNKIREEQLNLGNWYKKEITEYSNGKKTKEKKIIDYEVDAEEYNKIYVEITKEYDETEKLIKKFVLRKNKFNAVRSETNFDFIKGEIVTKYYDGEKDFATVTETLIGKDRAIVKRERVGDEVKIFDNYNKINEKSYNYIRNIIKNNSIYKVLKVNKNYNTFIFEYNDVKNGIDKNSFFYETFNLVAKEENGVTGQFGGEELEMYFYKNNSVIKKTFKDFYKKSYSNEESPIKDWENIIFYSNENELEKYFLKNEEKEISLNDYKKINMMEEFRNGY